MKIAVKFQSQNEFNNTGVPEYWPWKKIDIQDGEQANYESEGWTVYTQAEFDAYMLSHKPKVEGHYLNQLIGNVTYLDISVKKKKEFADDLIERLKKKNISEGINVAQGLWMHERVRALPIAVPGLPVFTIDLMNMVVSGDLELACIALQYTAPDNMTLPYHWLSQTRISWIVTDLKKFLGWP